MSKVEISWDKFLSAQSKLDSDIHTKKNLERPNTMETRKLALIVELYECINETKVFKFWSSSTPDKQKLLTEYVDVFHFTLSLCLDYKLDVSGVSFEEGEIKSPEFLLGFFMGLSGKVSQLLNKEKFMEWIKQFLNMGTYLGFKYQEIEESYFKKLDINFQRQLDNY